MECVGENINRIAFSFISVYSTSYKLDRNISLGLFSLASSSHNEVL